MLPEEVDLAKSIDAVCLQAEALLSQTSISSTTTASDLAGPGLTLGRLYSYLGKRLENWINELCARHGYGPQAIKRRLLAPPFHHRICGEPHALELKPKDYKRLKKDLKKLLAYTRSNIQSNQELALEAIASLAIADPLFSETLNSLNALHCIGLACLRNDAATHPLLSPSRKALICVVENKVNSAGHESHILRHEMLKEDSTLRTIQEDFFYRLFTLRRVLVGHIGSRYCLPSYASSWTLLQFNKLLSAAEYCKIPVIMRYIDRTDGLYNDTRTSLHHTVQISRRTVDWSAAANVTLTVQAYRLFAQLAKSDRAQKSYDLVFLVDRRSIRNYSERKLELII